MSPVRTAAALLLCAAAALPAKAQGVDLWMTLPPVAGPAPPPPVYYVPPPGYYVPLPPSHYRPHHHHRHGPPSPIGCGPYTRPPVCYTPPPPHRPWPPVCY